MSDELRVQIERPGGTMDLPSVPMGRRGSLTDYGPPGAEILSFGWDGDPSRGEAATCGLWVSTKGTTIDEVFGRGRVLLSADYRLEAEILPGATYRRRFTARLPTVYQEWTLVLSRPSLGGES